MNMGLGINEGILAYQMIGNKFKDRQVEWRTKVRRVDYFKRVKN